MFKITSQQDTATQGVFLIIEGRLAGLWVEELRTYCRMVSENQQRCTRIDLTGVTFIDAAGKALLARLWGDGAELLASGCLTSCVVKEITGGKHVGSVTGLTRMTTQGDGENRCS